MSEKPSIIAHPSHTRLLSLREDYMGICKGAQYPRCAAMILNMLEHWTNFKWEEYWQEREKQEGRKHYRLPTVWVFMTHSQIKTELMLMFGETVIAKSIVWLEECGYVKRRFNPKKKNDRTLQYLLMTNRVQKSVNAWAISKDAPGKVRTAAKAKQMANPPASRTGTTSSRTGTGTLPQLPFTGELNTTTFVAKSATGDIHSHSKDNPTPQTTKTKDPTPHVGDNPPPRQKGERDPMFDAVSRYIFGITSDEELKAMQASEKVSPRIGSIVSWLNQKKDYIPYGTKGRKDVGLISRPAEPDQVRRFAAWYTANNKTASMVTDGEKFVTYWRAWASTQNKQRQTPRPAPPAQPAVTYTQAQIEQRQRDLRAAKQGMGS